MVPCAEIRRLATVTVRSSRHPTPDPLMPKPKKHKAELIDYVCAAENNPDDFRARMALVGAYQQHGQKDKALQELAEMEKAFPGEAVLFVAWGNLHMKERSWRDAVEAYQSAIDTGARTEEVYYGLGLAYRGAGRIDDAKKAFSAAAALNPESLESFLCLASVLFETGEYDKAISILEGVRPRHNGDARLLHLLGAACSRKGDDFKASIFVEEGLKHTPEDKKLLALRAEILLQTRRFEEAIKEYDGLIAKHGEDSLFLCNRGLARETVGERRAALQDYDRALEIEPRNMVARTNRGMLHAGSGAVGKAIDDFEKALKIKPDDTVLLHNLGVACLKKGSLAGAEKALKKACKLKHQPSCDLLRKISQRKK